MTYKPRPYQLECIHALAEARASGIKRGLVNMASGLGKTLTGAFDIEQFLQDIPNARVLVLCHRETILAQTKRKFQECFGEDYSYGMYTGNCKTPRPTVDYFKPQFLLGLTATKDRMDGQDILEIYQQVLYAMDIYDGWAADYLACADYRIMLNDLNEDEFKKYLNPQESGLKVSIAQLNKSIFSEQTDADIASKLPPIEVHIPKVKFEVRKVDIENLFKESRRYRYWTIEEVISYFQQLVKELLKDSIVKKIDEAILNKAAKLGGATPTRRQLEKDPDCPSVGQIKKYYPTLNATYIALGLKINTDKSSRVSVTHENQKAEAIKMYEQLGRAPTMAEWDANPRTCRSQLLEIRYGNYNKAMLAFGITPNKRHAPIHNGIKRVGDIESGVPSPNLVARLQEVARKTGRKVKSADLTAVNGLPTPSYFHTYGWSLPRLNQYIGADQILAELTEDN